MKCFLKVFAKSWTVDVFLLSKLVAGLANNRVDDVETRDLVLGSTLSDKNKLF